MRTTAPPLPCLLTPRELAAALRVSEATAYRYLAAGVVPAIRVGGVLRIRADDLERLVGLGEDGSAPTSGCSAPTPRPRPR